MARRPKSRWIRLTDQEISHIRLHLQREATSLFLVPDTEVDPNQTISRWTKMWLIEGIILKIDKLYKDRS